MNEWKQKYYALVQHRQQQTLKHVAGQTEHHHIKPASLWPHLKSEPTNIVVLTVLEHIQAHKYLAYWYETEYGAADSRYIAAFDAYRLMCITRSGIELSDEDAAKLRADYARNCSTTRKGKPLSQKNIDNITKSWAELERRKAQSARIRHAYATGDARQKIAQANLRRMSDPANREVLRQAGLAYFKAHPEAKLKHSQDLKGRVHIYNVELHKYKMVKIADLQSWLENGWTLGTPLYYMPHRGKNKGKLFTMYVCPWKVQNCCWLRPNCRGQASKWSLTKPLDYQ